MTERPISIAILAMGGEGGGVLADWIADMAEHAGYFAQTTSVPGVAQRTGSTIYYLELFPESQREPVLALMPVPGEVDIVIASELMEAGRAVQRGLVTPDRTTLVASSHRVYSMTERTDAGDGRVDSEVLMDACRKASRQLAAADFSRVASEAGSVISAALFGALAGTGALPFEPVNFEDAIRRAGIGVEASLRAFHVGQAASLRRVDHPPAAAPAESAESVIRLGVERLTDYQDAAYASEYQRLLEPIRAADTRYGPPDLPLLRETARQLALWMSYEDAIRVADLKIRRGRLERVCRETRLEPGQLLRVREFLHPRTDELADILPAGLGRRLFESKWARGLVERATHRGMLVETTSMGGFLRLWALAKLRRWRRRTLRFAREQARIREWLEMVPELAARNYVLALEAARYPEMRRGYGETHTRGCAEFDRAMSAISREAAEVP